MMKRRNKIKRRKEKPEMHRKNLKRERLNRRFKHRCNFSDKRRTQQNLRTISM